MRNGAVLLVALVSAFSVLNLMVSEADVSRATVLRHTPVPSLRSTRAESGGYTNNNAGGGGGSNGHTPLANALFEHFDTATKVAPPSAEPVGVVALDIPSNANVFATVDGNQLHLFTATNTPSSEAPAYNPYACSVVQYQRCLDTLFVEQDDWTPVTNFSMPGRIETFDTTAQGDVLISYQELVDEARVWRIRGLSPRANANENYHPAEIAEAAFSGNGVRLNGTTAPRGVNVMNDSIVYSRNEDFSAFRILPSDPSLHYLQPNRLFGAAETVALKGTHKGMLVGQLTKRRASEGRQNFHRELEMLGLSSSVGRFTFAVYGVSTAVGVLMIGDPIFTMSVEELFEDVINTPFMAQDSISFLSEPVTGVSADGKTALIAYLNRLWTVHTVEYEGDARVQFFLRSTTMLSTLPHIEDSMEILAVTSELAVVKIDNHAVYLLREDRAAGVWVVVSRLSPPSALSHLSALAAVLRRTSSGTDEALVIYSRGVVAAYAASADVSATSGLEASIWSGLDYMRRKKGVFVAAALILAAFFWNERRLRRLAAVREARQQAETEAHRARVANAAGVAGVQTPHRAAGQAAANVLNNTNSPNALYNTNTPNAVSATVAVTTPRSTTAPIATAATPLATTATGLDTATPSATTATSTTATTGVQTTTPIAPSMVQASAATATTTTTSVASPSVPSATAAATEGTVPGGEAASKPHEYIH